MSHFSTSDHLAEVLEAYSHPVDDRTGEITRAAIKHLFAFAEEVGLTRRGVVRRDRLPHRGRSQV